MQKIFGIGLLVGIIAAGIYLKSCWPPDETQLAIQAKQAEIQLVQEQQKLVKMKVQAQADLLKIQNDSKIENAPQVMKARIATRTLTALWLPLSLLTAASVGAGVLLYTAIKPRSFRYGKLKTVVSRKQAAALAVRSLYVSGMSKAAKIAAFREEIGAARFTQGVTLFSALKNALRGRESVTPQASLPEAHVDDPARAIPDMQTILQNLEQGDQIVLGYDYETIEPLTGDFSQLYSGGTFGESGSGKSAWLRALILQSVLSYPFAEFHILDAHEANRQSLTAYLPRIPNFHFMRLANPIDDIRAFEKVFQARIDRGEEAIDRPLVLVVEELKAIHKKKWFPQLVELLERIPVEGRKYGVYLLLATQDVRIKSGIDFRDTLTSLYAFKNKPKQLQCLLQDTDEVAKIRGVNKAGIALFQPCEGESRLVRLPFCAPEMGKIVETRLRVNNTPEQTNSASNVIPFRKRPEHLNTPKNMPEQPSEQRSEHSEQASIQKQMTALKLSLNSLSKLSGVPKSSLSVYLNGGKLSEEYKHAIQETLSMLQKQVIVSA